VKLQSTKELNQPKREIERAAERRRSMEFTPAIFEYRYLAVAQLSQSADQEEVSFLMP
jgi:hypothetical protein